MNTRLVLVFACALSLGGCALTEETIDIPYKPVGGQQIGVGVKVTTSATDARTADRNRVSAKVNGYGMEMAAIRSKQEVTTVLKNALDSELKARGYSLEKGGNIVTISVKRFFNGFKAGFFTGDGIADVQFGVVVATPDGTSVYERDIAVTGKAESVMVFTGSNAAEALSDGMKKAFTTLFADEKFIAALRPTEPAAPAAQPASAPTNS